LVGLGATCDIDGVACAAARDWGWPVNRSLLLLLLLLHPLIFTIAHLATPNPFFQTSA
jgi:hypothetical protein